MINKIYELCNNIAYTRSVPDEAIELAHKHGYIILVGGGDDLMYAFGADCWLTKHCEWNYGWDGCDFSEQEDLSEELKKETDILGLKIWWCGKIKHTRRCIPDYDTEKKGAFSYTVRPEIESKEFTVLEKLGEPEVYCTGLIVKLPEGVLKKEQDCPTCVELRKRIKELEDARKV